MILSTLLSHYRRHPVQALFLLTGIIIANVLLAATQLINAQARASYAQGERFLQAGPAGHIRARGAGQAIDERHYIALRRQGFHELAPLLRRVVTTRDGTRVELLGIDALSMPRAGSPNAGAARPAAGVTGFSGFAFAPYQLWAASARVVQLGWKEGERVELDSGDLLPPLMVAPDAALGHRLLIDIGALQAVTDSAGKLSAILVFDMQPVRLEQLRTGLPDGLEYIAAETAPDPYQLTRSFHLNLAAMGLLAFVVGVFLVYNAMAFSYTDRRELIRKMRLAGVPRRELAAGLMAELGLFLAAGTVLGIWLGGLLAARLLPGVGQTLAQLYGVYIAYPDGIAPSGLGLVLAMVLLAALICAAQPLRQALAAPLLERWSAGWELRIAARRDLRMLQAGLVLLAGAALLAVVAAGAWAALTGLACLMLGTALCLPLVLRGLLRLAGRILPARRARLAWLVADSRWLLGPAALALMAVTLALVANSGLNTMIGSFRQATDDWLQQRLSAQLYLRGGPESSQLQAWLDRAHPGVQVAERRNITLDTRTPEGHLVRVEVLGFDDDPGIDQQAMLVWAEQGAAAAFARGEGLLVSERAWRLDGWDPGEPAFPCAAAGKLRVLGVYHDYGNPLSQWIVPEHVFRACWPAQGPVGRSLRGPRGADWGAISAELRAEFGIGEGAMIDQAELRAAGLSVFDRTFAVTRALNSLTLLVAGIGIFCAVSAIHHHRVGQQSLLASLGLTRRERGVLLLTQWGLLGLLCMALVWPFGVVLAAYLAGVVTPAAFGWSFPLVLEWRQFLVLAATASGSLLLAVLLPSLRLLRASPAAMLREQAV